jgi:hypothetical protein
MVKQLSIHRKEKDQGGEKLQPKTECQKA